MTLYDNFLTPKIIDNALPQTYADEIEELLYSNRFAWYYTDNLTTKDIRRSGFYHEYYRLGTIHSNHYNFIKIIPHIVTNKADIKQKFDWPKTGTVRFSSVLIDTDKPTMSKSIEQILINVEVN